MSGYPDVDRGHGHLRDFHGKIIGHGRGGGKGMLLSLRPLKRSARRRRA